MFLTFYFLKMSPIFVRSIDNFGRLTWCSKKMTISNRCMGFMPNSSKDLERYLFLDSGFNSKNLVKWKLQKWKSNIFQWRSRPFFFTNHFCFVSWKLNWWFGQSKWYCDWKDFEICFKEKRYFGENCFGQLRTSPRNLGETWQTQVDILIFHIPLSHSLKIR